MKRSDVLKKVILKESEMNRQLDEIYSFQAKMKDSGLEDIEINSLISDVLFSLSIRQTAITLLKAKLGIVGKTWYKEYDLD